LGRGHDAHDLHLLQDQGQRERREELAAQQQSKDHDRCKQHDQRNKRRCSMKRMVKPSNQPFLCIVKRGDLGFCACGDRLVIV
jgi:hypothetical protein